MMSPPVIDPNNWPDLWEAAIRAAKRHRCEVRPLRIDPPATEAEVSAMERRLRLQLPASFRHVLLRYTARMEFYWQLPDGERAPAPWGRDIFSGECSWDLASLPAAEESRRSWMDVFSDPSDPESAVWQDKLGFQFVANGDLVAIDLADGTDGRVVMLSHEGESCGHGVTLGRNFIDYVERLSRLGCPGNEGWQMLPFLGPEGLEPDGAIGPVWRDWFFGPPNAGRPSLWSRLWNRGGSGR